MKDFLNMLEKQFRCVRMRMKERQPREFHGALSFPDETRRKQTVMGFRIQ